MKYLSILFILIFSLSVFCQTDTTAPKINNFVYFPPIVNIANGSEDLTVGIRAFDDISGVNIIRVRFHSPSGNQIIDANFNYESRVSGDNKDELYNKTIIFMQYSETGTWLVEYVYTRDEEGNGKLFTYLNSWRTAFVPAFRSLPLIVLIC